MRNESIEAEWLDGGQRFWFARENAEGESEHVLVEAKSRDRKLLPDPSVVIAAIAENGLDSKAKYLALCSYLCLVNAALEEYVFRWFIYSRFRLLMRAGPAVAMAGLAFTAHHVVVLRAFFDSSAS